jgi:hypothetical protein
MKPSLPLSEASSSSRPRDSSQLARSTNLFQVYLRLRPPLAVLGAHGHGHAPVHAHAADAAPDRFLIVEDPAPDSPPTHITVNPPSDRRRAIEKYAFTQVFEEDATQLDVFHCTGVVSLVEGVVAPHGGDGTDALVATLGVTGSGKVGCIFFWKIRLV